MSTGCPTTVTPLQCVRATYSKVGPTSVRDSSLARTKKIQVRVTNGPANATPLNGATVLWGLKTASRMPNRGDGSQNTRFEGVFPRMAF